MLYAQNTGKLIYSGCCFSNFKDKHSLKKLKTFSLFPQELTSFIHEKDVNVKSWRIGNPRKKIRKPNICIFFFCNIIIHSLPRFP